MTKWRKLTLRIGVMCLILTSLLSGLTVMAVAQPPGVPSVQRQKDEADIQETALRALFAAYGKSVPHEVYYIALAFQDPPSAFMQRFKNHTPPVLVQSRAGKSSREMGGLKDRQTGKEGTVFSIQKIKWLSPTRVETEWHWYYWMKAGMGSTCRVEKINGKWKVKDIVSGKVWKN